MTRAEFDAAVGRELPRMRASRVAATITYEPSAPKRAARRQAWREAEP